MDEQKFLSSDSQRLLLDALQEFIVVLFPDGSIRTANQAALQLLGRSLEEIKGADFARGPWFGHDREISTEVAAALRRAAVDHRSRLDSEIVSGSSVVVPIDLVVSAVTGKSGAVIQLLVTARDISERKQHEKLLVDSEAQLRKSLLEKEVLLQEIHHRVKNNLQVVVSLLRLQRGGGAAARLVLAESERRIRTMALVHEQLYRSETLAEVDFATYARELVDSVCQAYSEEGGEVQAEIFADHANLGLDQLVPVGLILGEVVTNSIKHGFAGRTGGRIYISLLREAADYVLTMRDDGVGVPGDFEPEAQSSLGLRLVAMLSQQLRGDWRLEPIATGGTVVVVRFPHPAVTRG